MDLQKKQTNKIDVGTVITTKKALLMWFIVLFSYFLFIFSWTIVLQLKGDGTAKTGGFQYTFFTELELEKPSRTATQATNWTITLVRGLASLGIAWVITKISHKYAVLISMGFMMAAIPAAYLVRYEAFLIARALMALGGTMLIVYVQPIISRFFKNNQKALLSSITTSGYPLAVVCSFAFVLNNNMKNILLQNWQITATVVAAIIVIPLILYILFGHNFAFVSNTNTVQNPDIKPATYKELIKEKQTIFWVLWYGFWLIPAVLTTAFMPQILIKFSEVKDPVTNEVISSLKNSTVGGNISWNSFFPFIFGVGAVFSFLGSFFNKQDSKRIPFLMFVSSMMILSMICIVLGARFNQAEVTYVFSFLLGFLTFFLQGMFFNIPHEYVGTSPKRVSILFSYVWGFGYIIFTIVNIISTIILDEGGEGGGIGAVIFVFICLILMMVFGGLIKESRPNSKTIPWLKTKKA